MMIRILISLTALSFLMLFTMSARAAHPCPNGPAGPHERQVGVSGGGNGVAPVPVCEASGAEGAASSAPRFEGYDAERERQAQIERGVYNAFARGWSISKSSRKDQCKAIFSVGKQSIMIVLHRERAGPAIAVFANEVIPDRNDAGQIDIVVRQVSKDAGSDAFTHEAVVTAFHQGRSVLINLGPSESLLSSLSDEIHFNVENDGVRWIDLRTKGLHAVRDGLRECLQQR